MRCQVQGCQREARSGEQTCYEHDPLEGMPGLNGARQTYDEFSRSVDQLDGKRKQ
jgi:hypothetical protein